MALPSVSDPLSPAASHTADPPDPPVTGEAHHEAAVNDNVIMDSNGQPELLSPPTPRTLAEELSTVDSAHTEDESANGATDETTSEINYVLHAESRMAPTTDLADKKTRKPLAKGHDLGAAIEKVLDCLDEIYQRMTEFQDYVSAQKTSEKPLYLWTKYTRYSALSLAIGELTKATDDAKILSTGNKQAILPGEKRIEYFNEALGLSTSISNMTTFAMGVMNEKTGACINDLEHPSMSAIEKDRAQNIITTELGKLLKHCTEATNHVYSTMDLLQQLAYPKLYHFRLGQDTNNKKPRFQITWKNLWKYFVAGLAFLLFLNCITMLQLYYLGVTTAFSGPTCSEAMDICTGSRTYSDALAKTLSATTRVIESDIGNHIAGVNSLHKSYDGLLELCTDNSERIDNVWEALGPPNEHGLYYGDSMKCNVGEDQKGLYYETHEKLMEKLTRLRDDLTRYQKAFQLADLRLSRRIDNLQRGR